MICNQQELISKIIHYENIPIDHAINCPFDELYKNKTQEEINYYKLFYEDQIKNKKKSVKLASVGILCDRDVFNNINFIN